MIGTVLGGYQVISRIKDGSVGTVWKGRNPFNEDVAIKVLSPSHAKDAKKLKEFRNEAKTLALLKHPNIIRIVKFFDVVPQPYLIMEYFKSENLKHALLNMPERVRGKEFKILKQLGDALHAMHQQGVIHLDIKPENVLISETSEVRLIDFSIAQPVKGRLFKFGKTQWGGTPGYMAPEQIRGEAVSPATDQYAYGILAFELFARRTPFSAPNPNGLLEKHLSEPAPPLRKILPKTPPDVDRVLLRMLEKDPAARWSDLSVVSYELAKLTEKWGLWWVDAGLGGTTRTSAHTARLMQPTTPPQGPPPGTARIAVRGADDIAMRKTHPIPTTQAPKSAETVRAKPPAPLRQAVAPRSATASPPAAPAPEPWRPLGERTSVSAESAPAAPAAVPAAPPAAAIPNVPAPGPGTGAVGRKTSRILPAVAPDAVPAVSDSRAPVQSAPVPAAVPAPAATVPAPEATVPAPEEVASSASSMDGLDALLQDRLQRRIDEERQRKQKNNGGEGASSEAPPPTAPHESDMNLPAVR
jgi:hypothetical protein